jgi:hypothetical protein
MLERRRTTEGLSSDVERGGLLFLRGMADMVGTASCITLQVAPDHKA